MLFRPMLLRLPAAAGLGLGLSGTNSDAPKLDAPKLVPSDGLGEPSDPMDERLAPFMAFCSSGLLGDPMPAKPPAPLMLPLPLIGLARLLEAGEVEKLRRLLGEPTDGVRENRGGVLYADPGVGGLEDGGRPSNRR